MSKHKATAEEMAIILRARGLARLDWLDLEQSVRKAEATVGELVCMLEQNRDKAG